MRSGAFALGTLGFVALLLSEWSGAGRGLWHPYFQAFAFGRSHEAVVRDVGPLRRPALREAVAAVGLSYPPSRLTLVGLKRERVLEAWASRGMAAHQELPGARGEWRSRAEAA